MFQDGEKHARRGYWGDILVSPYIALGIECEEESFFKKNNKQFTSVSMLTLNAPIATKVVCFSRLLKCLRSLNGKQCGP